MARERSEASPRLRWHRTTIEGRAVFYGEAGEGPPAVFFHGWGLTARTYADALPAVVRAGARVIAPALPGFGRSDELPGDLTWEHLARWTDQLLEHAGVDEPAFLVGHSFGGAVATMTAWHYPARARSLVLVNSIGGAVWKNGREGPRHLAERPWWDWGLRMPRELASKDFRRVLRVVARDFAGNVVRHPSNLLRAGTLARHADLREQLTDLAARGLPVTILWGNRDRLLPEAAHVAMCEAAGAEGDIVSDAGHAWLLADPESFGEIVTNSLTVHALLARRG